MALTTALAGSLGYKEIKKTSYDHCNEIMNDIFTKFESDRMNEEQLVEQCTKLYEMYSYELGIPKEVSHIHKNEAINDLVDIAQYNKRENLIIQEFINDSNLPLDDMAYKMRNIEKPYGKFLRLNYFEKINDTSNLTPEELANSYAYKNSTVKRTLILDFDEYNKEIVLGHRSLNKHIKNFESFMELD